MPDEKYAQEAKPCIIQRQGETNTTEQMRGYIAKHMARHKVPRYIEFVDSFPMNAAGKILKYKMREQAAEKLGLSLPQKT